MFEPVFTDRFILRRVNLRELTEINRPGESCSATRPRRWRAVALYAARTSRSTVSTSNASLSSSAFGDIRSWP
jgi:hypothetical protein